MPEDAARIMTTHETSKHQGMDDAPKTEPPLVRDLGPPASYIQNFRPRVRQPAICYEFINKMFASLQTTESFFNLNKPYIRGFFISEKPLSSVSANNFSTAQPN